MNALKHGQRAQMLPTARDLWPAASELQSSTAAQNNALSRCCKSLSPVASPAVPISVSRQLSTYNKC